MNDLNDLNDIKAAASRLLYREMVRAARGGSKDNAFYEMCAAGWMPETTDRRAQLLSNPFLGAQINLAAKGSSLYKVHFDLMGEDVPQACYRIHPLDNDAMRWRCASLGVPAPIPQSVASRAFTESNLDQAYEGIEPPVSVVDEAIANVFPNWKELGREYFEPKQAA